MPHVEATHVDTPSKTYKHLSSFLSGGLAGMAAKTLIAPFDRVKIIFQTSRRPFTYSAGLKEGLHLYQTQGYRSLWRGNTAVMLRVFPYAAIQFGMFDVYQSLLLHPTHTGVKKHGNNFLAGSLAGITATIFTYPAEFLATRMAMDVGKYGQKTLVSYASSIYKTEGIRAFFNGVMPSLVGIIPCHGTSFLIFHFLKEELAAAYPKYKHNKVADFIFGAVSGCIAQLVSYPFDVVRKKMQAQNVLIARGEINHKMGMLSWAKHVLSTERLRGLYKGYTLHLVKAPLACGTSFAVKNMLTRSLEAGFKY